MRIIISLLIIVLSLPAQVLIPIMAGGQTTQFIGLVATRCRVFNMQNTGVSRLMSRSKHVATTDITKLAVILQNYMINYASPAADTGNGGSATVTASVEYPAGTFTQIKFGGSTSGTMPNGGTITSDYATVTIPSGSTFWIREFDINSSGVFFFPLEVSGEALNIGNALTDQTMGGTITNVGAYSHPPLAIIAPTTAPSVCIIGDSIGFGYNDNDKLGVVAKSLPSTLAYINLSANANTTSSFISGASARSAVFGHCTHLVSELGINDYSTSVATVLSNLQSIWSTNFPKARVTQTTLTPKSSSTDSWATLANQTAQSATFRAAFNSAIKTGISGQTCGYYDIAAALESGSTGKWIASPSPPYTADGLHPNTAGYNQVVSAGVVAWPPPCGL